MSSAPGDIRFSLRLKLLIFGGLLAVLPAWAVGLGLMEVNASTLETQNRELRLAVADDIAETIEGALKDAHHGLLSLQQALTNPEVAEDNRIEVATALLEANALLETVAIYDQQGNFITQIDQTGEGFGEEAIAAELAQKASSETLVIEGVEVDEEGAATLMMTVAIRPGTGTVTGFLRTAVPLEDAQKRTLALGHNQLSTRSGIDVVDSERRVLLSTDLNKIGKTLDADGLIASIDTIIAQGVAHSGDHPTKPYLVSARPLKTVPWVTRVTVPMDEAYASLTRMRWIVAVGTGIAAALALLLAFIFARRLTSPLKEVVAFTQKLGARDFDAQVEVATRDEIGVVARSLNDAARELKSSEEQIAREMAIRADLGRYLPEELVENVVRREQAMELGGQRRQITVLFADVVRFTPMCEHHTPEVVVTILNELFTLITTIIFRHGGTVDKFIGDCVMAFWGAPKPDDEQVLHALDAAEQISRVLEFANQRWMRDFGVEVKLAMGIHTGEAVVGNVGSNTRMEYTAIGKAVNHAARLEALAHENQILVSEEVQEGAQGRFEFRHASTELLSVGGDETVVYEVLL